MNKYISIDTGGTFIKHGLIREDGKILERGKVPTPQTSLPDYLDAVKNICRSYEEFCPEPVLSMSLPGTVDRKTGTIRGQSSLFYIHNVPFRQLAEEATGMKIMMENDANCAALGETWLGCAKELSSAAFLIFGTGLGGALCLEGKLIRGYHLAAGEFSDFISGFDGESMRFRNVDTVISTRKAAAKISEITGIREKDLNGEIIFSRAADKIQPYAEAANRICLETAVLAFNIQHVFDPEAIILGGGMSAQDLWYSQTNRYLNEIYSRAESFAPVNLLKSEIGNNANLLGALKNTLNDREQ